MAPIDNSKLYNYLKDLKVISADILDEALKDSNSREQSLADTLYEKDLLTDEQIGELLADLYNLPFIKLSQQEIPAEVLSILPEEFSKKQKIVIFKKDKTTLHLATANPENSQALDFVAKKTGENLKLYFATQRDLKSVLETHQETGGKKFQSSLDALISQAQESTSLEHPVISLVEKIIAFAHENSASDIHIEPQEKQSTLRLRIDGMLHDISVIPANLHQQIVTRIKVMAQLRTDEHQSAQDGKIQFSTEDEKLDLRVSITPTIDGEKVVMRILASKSRQFSLSNLGLSDSDLKKVEDAYHKPYGMILSTGPTGSGKTTTLYAILKLLNKRNVNIMTIEDPVEYEIEGINQIQVNSQTNLTFSDGLRSIVRQDPDIVLVGEIRDHETAQIATNAAMTGHLVLSTLHTNDAATTIPRLTEQQVEPFLVASSVNCIIGQRLVRQICTKCRSTREISQKDFASYGFSNDLVKKFFKTKTKITIYQGKGCPICHNTGYSGRIGIFEVMTIDNDIRKAITSQQTAEEISTIAVKKGMTTMLFDGLKKVTAGLTSIEEVLRVTKI